MKMGSLFSGSGGFELAGERVGFHTVWESEIEPFPMRVTQMRFPDAEHLGDISRINGAQVKPVDVVTGGSPCQNMSIAGNRTGLDGEKSVLFREYVRIVKEMRVAHGKPRFMVWENVPGAFSSNKGEDFRCVLEKSPESHKSEFLFLDLRAGDGSQPEASWETATAWRRPARHFLHWLGKAERGVVNHDKTDSMLRSLRKSNRTLSKPD